MVRESRFSYAGLSALYPVGEEDTDDEDLEIPKSGRISSRPCHNILTREAVGMADQSPTGAILRDMETSSLNYYSSSSCTGSSSSQPVIHPLGKLRDDDLEAARFYQEPNVAAIDSEHMPEDELKVKGGLSYKIGAIPSRERERERAVTWGGFLVHEDHHVAVSLCILRRSLYCSISRVLSRAFPPFI